MDSTSSLGRKTEELGGLSKKTQYMVETALLVAVTIIMGNTFLGTIPTPLLLWLVIWKMVDIHLDKRKTSAIN